MDFLSFYASTLLLFTLTSHAAALAAGNGAGGGIVSQLPAVPNAVNSRLQRDLATINQLKAWIQQNQPLNDPKNITAGWTGNNPCKFKGFICSMHPVYKEMTLSDVQFNGFLLRAPLKGFIDKLLDISIFHANTNRFFGVVPPINSTTIPYLFELDLSNNKLSGNFPTQVLAATNLTFLDIRFNNFLQTVPPQVFNLNVDVLFINNNNFNQQIPSNLGSTPALYLTLANNRFTGGIPSSIGKAQNTLLEVLFLNNKLSGCLPWQIGQLKLSRVFDFRMNKFHGPIPSTFGCLGNMQILDMSYNHLSGAVPESLCALPKLTRLRLGHNYFTKVGPICKKLIAKKVLDVSENCIGGQLGQRPAKVCRDYTKIPLKQCPSQYPVVCKAENATLTGNGGGHGRRTAEVGPPVVSAAYAALNRPGN